MWWRKVELGAVLAAATVALSGCVVFKSNPTARQKGSSVVLKVKGCASETGGSPPPGSCANDGNSNSNAGPVSSQVFLGFLVPAKAKAPSSFSAATGPVKGQPKISFTPSASYKQQLQTLSAAPSGEKWVGYQTTYLNYSPITPNQSQQNFTAKVSFGLSKHAKGKFKYRVVIGGRSNSASSPDPNEPVNCEGSLTTLVYPSSSEDLICVDDSFSSSLKLK